MKIAIDISQIVYETGVARYTQSLITHLLEVDRENEYILFGGSLRRLSDLRNFTRKLNGKFKANFYPIPPSLFDFLGNILHFPNVEILTGKVDVFHSSDWTQPRSNAFNVTTIHDLAPILLPESTDPKIVEVHKRRLFWIKKEVDRVIVPTQATKMELLELGFNEKKIRVIYEGVDEIFKPQPKSAVEKTKHKYGIEDKYFLSVGTGARKNTDSIIAAVNKLNLPSHDLVIVGRSLGSSTKGGDSDLVFAGGVLDSDLTALYSGADALIYPSLSEGFGLPILEAFACGCPVVTSNISGMAEVAGDAAVLVDPHNIGSIVNGIKNAIRNREVLIRKGRERLKFFSWTEAARETLEIYNEASK